MSVWRLKLGAAQLGCALAVGIWCGKVAAQPAGALPALRAQVEHVVDLPATADSGEPVLELSALAWDPLAQQLVAASDRGQLFRLHFSQADGRLSVRVGGAQRLQLPSGDALGAEALFWRAAPGGGGLWAGAEHDGRAWSLDGQGRAVQSQPWPQALQRTDLGEHGVEALAWQEPLGLLAGLQASRPWVVGDKQPWHALHAEDRRRWLWLPAAAGSALKAVEPWPGQGLLVLERLPVSVSAGRLWRPRLRVLWLLQCGQALPCTPQEVVLTPGLPDGPHNFEGLACAGDGRCWLVSDGGRHGRVPTRLVQLRLVSVP